MITLESIRAGLDAGEFFLEYIPTVSLEDGRCLGAEALIRWRRPDGVVPPLEFVPLSENTALSGLLTYRVIDLVAAEMKNWLRANPAAHLSINIPPEILGRGGLEYAARNSGLYELIGQLILEITERGVPDLQGVNAINSSWATGLRVALDDVTLSDGANLAVLARSRFDVLKLDRTLISQIDPTAPPPEWLQGITTLIRTSKLMVIAEGVETLEQVQILQAAHIQAAQGFYFSQPLPAPDFLAFHQSREKIPS